MKHNSSGTNVPIIFLVGDKMKCTKKGMILGLTGAAFVGAGLLIYNFILSPKTKQEMLELEHNMCKDFENMM